MRKRNGHFPPLPTDLHKDVVLADIFSGHAYDLGGFTLSERRDILTATHLAWNGKLIFVFHQEEQYDKPLSGKVTSKKENRYYFDNDKLIKWIDENGKEVADLKSAEDQYLKSSKELTAGAMSKAKTIESKP